MIEVTSTNSVVLKSLCIDSRTTIKELTDVLNDIPESWYLKNVVGYDEVPIFLTFYEPAEAFDHLSFRTVPKHECEVVDGDHDGPCLCVNCGLELDKGA